VVAGVVVLVLVLSLVVAFVSALPDFVVVFASALANFVVLFASAFADFVEGEVVFVALAVVVFGPPFVVFGDETFVVFGDEACVVFGDETFVVFGDEAFVDDTCCGFGVDPFLPCAGTVTDEATTNATAERSVIIVRVMNPPRGHSPNT
jgi:hypothetical protein